MILSKKGYFYDLACDFEREFSGIEVDVNDMNIQVKISPQTCFQLQSMKLTIFSLYLKKGDLLIIEEPEAHLHPEKQLLLIEYIVKSVNMGLNVILTIYQIS